MKDNNILNKIKKTYLNALNLDEKLSSKYNDLNETRHYPPANKNWFNNIYVFFFCNGLIIIRKKIWINRNVSIMKKSFYSGIKNIARKFIFSKIFANIINPFDSLESQSPKKIKKNHKRLYIFPKIADFWKGIILTITKKQIKKNVNLTLSLLFFRIKKKIKLNFLDNFLKIVKNKASNLAPKVDKRKPKIMNNINIIVRKRALNIKFFIKKLKEKYKVLFDIFTKRKPSEIPPHLSLKLDNINLILRNKAQKQGNFLFFFKSSQEKKAKSKIYLNKILYQIYSRVYSRLDYRRYYSHPTSLYYRKSYSYIIFKLINKFNKFEKPLRDLCDLAIKHSRFNKLNFLIKEIYIQKNSKLKKNIKGRKNIKRQNIILKYKTIYNIFYKWYYSKLKINKRENTILTDETIYDIFSKGYPELKKSMVKENTKLNDKIIYNIFLKLYSRLKKRENTIIKYKTIYNFFSKLYPILLNESRKTSEEIGKLFLSWNIFYLAPSQEKDARFNFTKRYRIYKHKVDNLKKLIIFYINQNLKEKFVNKKFLSFRIFKKNIKNKKSKKYLFNMLASPKKNFNFFSSLQKNFRKDSERSLLNYNARKIDFRKDSERSSLNYNVRKRNFRNNQKYLFKINILNIKKYSYIFEIFNIKNPIFSSYYFKQLKKGFKRIMYKKNVQSIKKILYLKMDYKKILWRFKYIVSRTSKSKKLKNILQKAAPVLTATTTSTSTSTDTTLSTSTAIAKNRVTFTDTSVNTITPVDTVTSVDTLTPVDSLIPTKNLILIYQSDNILKKRLNTILPLYIYYLQMIHIHNYKYKNWFLLGLKNIICNLYQKKVVFNIINLKYIHLSSDMLSESMAVKLRDRKNRILKVLTKALKLIKMPSLHLFLSLKNKTNKLCLGGYKTLKIHSNVLKKKSLVKKIIGFIKHKKISGIRLEAGGRLTKRLTASRSIFKIKHKGSLKNIDSSYKNLSSVLLRGHMKSNIQHTKISSKTRNGAFGLKTWISSY